MTEEDPEALRVLVEPWRGKTRITFIAATPDSLDVHLDYAAYRHGYNPVYQFLNLGVLRASEPWVMLPAGDDSYFPPGWEELLDMVDPAEAHRACWVPRYLSVQSGPHGPPVVRPCEYTISIPEPIRESELRQAVESWRKDEIVRETPGKRELVSWVHAVMHKDLFERAGRYQTMPPYPEAHDLHLNDALRDKLGAESIGVHRAVIVNARAGVRMGE